MFETKFFNVVWLIDFSPVKSLILAIASSGVNTLIAFISASNPAVESSLLGFVSA